MGLTDAISKKVTQDVMILVNSKLNEIDEYNKTNFIKRIEVFQKEMDNKIREILKEELPILIQKILIKIKNGEKI